MFYYSVTEFVFSQLRMPNHALTGQESNLPFSPKSVVSITHEQNIIQSEKQLDSIAHEQTIIFRQYLQVTCFALGQ